MAHSPLVRRGTSTICLPSSPTPAPTSPQIFAHGQETSASSSPWASPTIGKRSPTGRRSSSSRAWSRSLGNTPAAASPPYPTLTSASLTRSSEEPRDERRPPNLPLINPSHRRSDHLLRRADLQCRPPRADKRFPPESPTRPSILPAVSMVVMAPAQIIPERHRAVPCPRTGTLRQRASLRASTRPGIYAVRRLP